MTRAILLFSLLYSIASWGNPSTLIYFGLTGQTIRLTPEHSVELKMVRAAMRVCADIEEVHQIPEYFCLSQVQFSQEQQPFMPSNWPHVLAQALRRQVMMSPWLMGMLETSVTELQGLPVREFIKRYLENTEKLKVVSSWVNSRASQIQQQLESSYKP